MCIFELFKLVRYIQRLLHVITGFFFAEEDDATLLNKFLHVELGDLPPELCIVPLCLSQLCANLLVVLLYFLYALYFLLKLKLLKKW